MQSVGIFIALAAAVRPFSSPPVSIIRVLPPFEEGAKVVTSPSAQRLYAIREKSTSLDLDVYGSDGKRVGKKRLRRSTPLFGTDRLGQPMFENASFDGDPDISLKVKGDAKVYTDPEALDSEFKEGIRLQTSETETILTWRPRGGLGNDAVKRLPIRTGGWMASNAWNVSPNRRVFGVLPIRAGKMGWVDLDADQPSVAWVTLRKADGSSLESSYLSDLCLLNSQTAVALIAEDELIHPLKEEQFNPLAHDLIDFSKKQKVVLVGIEIRTGKVEPLACLKLAAHVSSMSTLGSNGEVALWDCQALRILRIGGTKGRLSCAKWGNL